MGFGEWVLAAFRAQAGELARLPRTRHDVHLTVCPLVISLLLHFTPRHVSKQRGKEASNVGLVSQI